MTPKSKSYIKLKVANSSKLTTQQSLFEMSKKEKADWNKKVKS
jgi:hypothetical protein